MLLRMVVESIQRNVRNTSHVFQLSHDAFKCATFQTGATAPDPTMLHVAMQLSMQVYVIPQYFNDISSEI